MIHEFKQPIFVNTPLGEGIALLFIDYGYLENTVWVVSLSNDGQIKHFNSEQVKLCKNYTYGISCNQDRR